jgi:[ribosomal protein S5]-alanine N-acetyltransferase
MMVTNPESMYLEPMYLETARLCLRPFAPADVDDLHRLWTDAAVRRYLWDDEVIDRETVVEVVESSRESFRTQGFGFWTLAFRGDDAGGGPEVEILYGVAPAHWGGGIATEAVRAVLRFGFERVGLATIFAGADPPNVASIRVMEKLGMTFARRTRIHGLEAIYYACSRAHAEISS